MARVLVMAGSNQDRVRSLRHGLALLRSRSDLTLRAVSPAYESEGVGAFAGQPAFYNMALLLETDLAPAALRGVLREIEALAGRDRRPGPIRPRTLDLDIVLYGSEVVALEGRRIPDPDIASTPYLAVPLADIAPDWVHPELGATLGEIAAGLRYTEKELHRAMDITSIVSDSHYATDIDARADEVYDPEFESLVERMLRRLGEDPAREGLRRTPLRVAKAMDFLTSGYRTQLRDVVNDAIFEDCCQEMVVVRHIEFYSMCEHHMLPFFGRATVGYVPDGRIIGLSKVARVVDMFARRFQVQERLTNQIADVMMEVLSPHGVGVILEASHFCMMMRGVEKQSSSTVTSALRGSFQDDIRTRTEFMELARSV